MTEETAVWFVGKRLVRGLVTILAASAGLVAMIVLGRLGSAAWVGFGVGLVGILLIASHRDAGFIGQMDRATGPAPGVHYGMLRECAAPLWVPLLALIATEALFVTLNALRDDPAAWFLIVPFGTITGFGIWDVARALVVRRRERERGVIYFERLAPPRQIPSVAGKAPSTPDAADASAVYSRLMRGEGARPGEIAALADSPARIDTDSADVYRRLMAGDGADPDEIVALAPATDRLMTTGYQWLPTTLVHRLSGEPSSSTPRAVDGPFIAVPSSGGGWPPPPIAPGERV